MIQKPNYLYNAVIIEVTDGDTMKVAVDLGFGVLKKTKIRLYGIDTPESRGRGSCQKGKDVKKYVKDMLLGKAIVLKSQKKGKYGRYLAVIWVQDDKGKFFEVNKHLVDKKMAKMYFGGKRG